MALRAVAVRSFDFQTLAQGLVVVLRDHRVDRHWHIGDRAGEQFLAHPLATAHRIGGGVAGKGNQPRGMRQQPAAVFHLGGLGRRIIPAEQVEVKRLGHFGPAESFAAARIRGARHAKDRGERRGHRLLGAEPLRVVGHHSFEDLDLIRASARFADHVQIQPGHGVLAQERNVRDQLFRLEVLPIEIFEVIIDFANALGRCGHRLVVAAVIDVELLGREEPLEYVLVIFQNQFHQHIGFAHQAARGLGVIAAESVCCP